jgi:competence protein ComEA
VGNAEGEAPADARRRLGLGAAVVLVIAALAVTVGIGLVRSAASPVDVVPMEPAEDSAAPSEERSARELYVHVSGAVGAPGLYVLPADARVVDAVAVAGGFTSDADRAAVNLARPLADGEQLHVAVEGDTGEGAQGAGAPLAGAGAPPGPGAGLIDLNTADLSALDTLPRIGPALAQRIIDWREENGRFTSVDDLLAVPGIGDAVLAGLRDLVTV